MAVEIYRVGRNTSWKNPVNGKSAWVYTGVLFPNTDFGDVSIAYIMEQLYNSTM